MQAGACCAENWREDSRMQLNFAFLANSSEVTPDGRFFVLGGGIDGFSVESPPGILPSLCMIASISFEVDECDQVYEFRAKLFLPDGTDTGAEVRTPLHPKITNESPGFGPNMKVSLGFFGLIMPQLGRYRFALSVADRHLGDVFFNIHSTGTAAPGEPR